MSEEGTITIKKDDLWRYATFALLAVVLIGGFFVFTGGNPTGNVNDNPGEQQQGVVEASVDDDPVMGDPNAPVTIIEFSDYQCPFCQRFWAQTLPSIKEQYIDTGKAKLVYRDLPIPQLHQMAQSTAEAAECVRDAAGSDEAYFEYHDVVFSNQQALSVDNLKTWAQDMGYDISSCLDSGEFRSEVQKDVADAQATKLPSERGVGTPRFIVKKTGEDEGFVVSGAQPFGVFQQVIESQL